MGVGVGGEVSVFLCAGDEESAAEVTRKVFVCSDLSAFRNGVCVCASLATDIIQI